MPLRQRTIERAWRRGLAKEARRRERRPPPTPAGPLAAGECPCGCGGREGERCPCGCGGVMVFVDGVLTAQTLDVVDSNGRISRG